VGRNVIFPGPGDAAPPPPTFHTKAFDTRTEPVAESYGNWRLGVLMRTRVFVDELKMMSGVKQIAASGRRTESNEYDEFDDGQSRHILGLCTCLLLRLVPRQLSEPSSISPHLTPTPPPYTVGDAPVAFARWRVMTVADVDGGAGGEDLVAVIDRLLVMRDYRGRRYGVGVLVACLTDILRMLIEARPPVSRIAMFVPVQDACLPAAHTAVACGLASVGAARMVDPTGATGPAFLTEAGVQEFSMTTEALSSAYAAALAVGPAADPEDDPSAAAAAHGGGGGYA